MTFRSHSLIAIKLSTIYAPALRGENGDFMFEIIGLKLFYNGTLIKEYSSDAALMLDLANAMETLWN